MNEDGWLAALVILCALMIFTEVFDPVRVVRFAQLWQARI